jgi:carbohydrate diacid regulator
VDSMISPALAQRIVDQLAAFVVHNVNLMDADGVIIASLDASRVGTAHWAAQRAARTRGVVRIAAHEATDYVRPGINAPIIMQGGVVGVVGVTGDPGEIDAAAGLLLLTLRLILDAETEHDARSIRDKLARELLAALAAGTLDRDVLRARAAAAGGAVDAPFRLVVAFDEPVGDSASYGHAAPPAAAARILRAARVEHDRIAVVDFDALWVIGGGPAISSMDTVVHGSLESKAAVIDSGPLTSEAELVDAVRRIRALLAVPALLHPGHARLDDLESEALIAQMEPSARRALADRTVSYLSPHQRHTAAALVASGGSPQRTAVLLGLHRNSLSARLAVLARGTSRDPRAPGELRRLALGLLAHRALGRD